QPKALGAKTEPPRHEQGRREFISSLHVFVVHHGTTPRRVCLPFGSRYSIYRLFNSLSTASISGLSVLALKSNVSPAASHSSGNGRLPPRASASRYFRSASRRSHRAFCQS